MMNRVLLALDGSDRDQTAFAHARRLAGPGAVIDLLHVVPSRPVPVGTPLLGMMDELPGGPVAAGSSGAEVHLSGSFPSSHPESAEDETQVQDGAARYLAEFRKRVAGGQDIVRTGSPADAILEVALTFDVDMIVMATHARSRFARWFLGSVSGDVLKRSQLPVLLVRGDLAPPPRPLRSILVPLDGDREARAVLSVVKPLAVRLEAKIVLLQVLEPGRPSHDAGEVCQDLTRSGAAWQCERAQGDPAEEILRHAAARSVDLIAMSVAAQDGSRLLDGRVARAVLGRSDVPVLIQHPVIVS